VEPPSDLIQSVSRALRVLEVVGEAPQGLPPKAVARRAGLHLSTTYHLLRTLEYEGYLVRTTDGDYRLGLAIARRFRDLQTALDGRPATTAVLRRLSTVTGRSAYLARFVDGRIAITSVVETAGSPHLEDLVPGFDEGAHATALGKSLLSTLARPRRRAYLREQGLRPFTGATVCDPVALDHELGAAVTDRVYVEQGQYRHAVSCAAALVPTGDPDDPWWSVAVSASTPAFTRDRPALVRALQVAAVDLAA
jgi:DNA-binding IclR family transcriptional regulator